MTTMTDSRAVEVLAAMFQHCANNRQMVEADALSHAIARLREPAGVEGVRRYLAARDAKPMRGTDAEVIHAIHVGTEWEAELRVSDLRALAQQPAAVDGARRLIGLMREVVPALRATGVNVTLADDVERAAAIAAQQGGGRHG